MDYTDNTFLIGKTLIEVWESQSLHEDGTLWKWRIVDSEEGDTEWQGHTDFKEDAIIHALKHLTYKSLRESDDRGLLESLWPGLEAYRPKAPAPPDED